MILTRNYINFSPKTLILNKMHCVKSVQIRSSFWSEFSCIPYSVRIKENTDRKELGIWTLFTHWWCWLYHIFWNLYSWWEMSQWRLSPNVFDNIVFCIRFIETERLPPLQNYFFAFLWLMNIFIWNKMFYSRDI